jgi:hypothetical protein
VISRDSLDPLDCLKPPIVRKTWNVQFTHFECFQSVPNDLSCPASDQKEPSPMARPRPKLTLWMRLRRFIRYCHSPLRLRSSIVRLRHNHRQPYLALLRLFIPFPTWYFPIPPQVPLKDLLGNSQLVTDRRGDIVNLRTIPLWRARDTPLRSLYRLYECMASGVYPLIGTETEYFWYQYRRNWGLKMIEDPRDSDPVRYAILACLVEELVKAFNWRLSIGMRRNRQHIHRITDEDPYPSFTPEILPPWTKGRPRDRPAAYGWPSVDNGGSTRKANSRAWWVKSGFRETEHYHGYWMALYYMTCNLI